MNVNYKFKEILGSKYPIVAAAMNQVSDLTLARAVRQAGAVPSLSIYNYYKNNRQRLVDDLTDDLTSYKNEFNDLKLFLSLGDQDLKIPAILDLILKFKIEFIELILENNIDIQQELLAVMSNNTKVFVKCLSVEGIINGITGVILKGNEGAGRGTDSLASLFDQVKSEYPHLEIIVSGGIGTHTQVKHYMDRGALAISIGTLLAASEESNISTETKLKIINSTGSDIKQFALGAKQNALIFSTILNDDFNHTGSLRAGIRNANTGHVFVGQSINQIHQIRSVKEIISSLVYE
jgi:NAD(P)H-dependent flavin oxidoreductase YrpB (nitropropane dioxygenase family)